MICRNHFFECGKNKLGEKKKVRKEESIFTTGKNFLQGEKFLEIRQGKDIEKVFWEKKCVVVGKSPYSANFFGIVEYWEREKPTWDFFQFYSDLGESRKK